MTERTKNALEEGEDLFVCRARPGHPANLKTMITLYHLVEAGIKPLAEVAGDLPRDHKLSIAHHFFGDVLTNLSRIIIQMGGAVEQPRRARYSRVGDEIVEKRKKAIMDFMKKHKKATAGAIYNGKIKFFGHFTTIHPPLRSLIAEGRIVKTKHGEYSLPERAES